MQGTAGASGSQLSLTAAARSTGCEAGASAEIQEAETGGSGGGVPLAASTQFSAGRKVQRKGVGDDHNHLRSETSYRQYSMEK